MRRFLLRAAVGGAALIIGVLIGSIHQRLVQKQPSANVAPAVVPQLPAQPAEAATLPAVETYPEDNGLRPYDIESFIDKHPQADLTRLFERLNVRGYGVYPIGSTSGWQCGKCKAQTFNYNLDHDAHSEVVLRIADEMRESYRYLIFKDRAYDDTELLGHIDAWGKYRPSMHAVLLSGGKQWLVVESQAARGTGLSAYLQTIYQVSPRGVKPTVSYLSEIYQSGHSLFPGRQIVGQPVSCEIKDGRMKATVSYTVEYFIYYEDQSLSLFTNHQTAVLTAGVDRGSTRLDSSASDITANEFETVFKIDSLFDDEFLRYNRSELRAIADGRDSIKKQWLKEYLKTCESGSRIKRELLSLLR